MSAARTESRSRRSNVEMMSTDGRGMTCDSIPSWACASLPATSCAREEGATAVIIRRVRALRQLVLQAILPQCTLTCTVIPSARQYHTCCNDRLVLQSENTVLAPVAAVKDKLSERFAPRSACDRGACKLLACPKYRTHRMSAAPSAVIATSDTPLPICPLSLS